MKATKEQFDAYIEVRNSGETNMLDVARIIQLAQEMSEVKLNREQCLDIIHNFAAYEEASGESSRN